MKTNRKWWSDLRRELRRVAELKPTAVSLDEAAKDLGLSVRALQGLVRRRTARTFRSSGRVMLTVSEVRRLRHLLSGS